MATATAASTQVSAREGWPARAPAPAAPSGHYLISPLGDSVLFIFSPLLALLTAFAVSRTELGVQPIRVLGVEQPPLQLVIGTLIAAHLFISFFRSHGNPAVFRQHPLRFTLVPVLLLAALASSSWLRAAGATLAVLWDVHHSGMQTFGLARMYDRKHGNDAAAGRSLDLALNHLLYAGPIAAGAGLMYHVYGFYSFETVGAALLTAVPAAARSIRPWLALAVLAAGIPFLAYYVLAYERLRRRGHAISPQKVALLASTGLCSIVSWGFNSFGVALMTMKLFHVVQYVALVGWVEQASIARLLHLRPGRRSFPVAVIVLLGVGLAYGFWAEINHALPDRSELALSLIISVTLLHFWYDGFIWSVRRRQL